MTTNCAQSLATMSNPDIFGSLNAMLVDDLPAIRHLLRQMLLHLGVCGLIKEAGDGLQAWETLQTFPADLVICDISMPRLNGIELLKKLRASPLHRHTPFLLITGEVAEDLVAAAVSSDVDGYLMKPFRLHTLETRLRGLLLSRQLRCAADSLFFEARRLLNEGLASQAVHLLLRLLGPPEAQEASILNLLGECFLALGDDDQAAWAYSRATALSPGDVKATLHLAHILERQGRVSDACVLRHRALLLEPALPAPPESDSPTLSFDPLATLHLDPMTSLIDDPAPFGKNQV
jgi:two-component system chemotaxis response regulator CheY